MPKVPIDYSKCVLYRIVNIDNENLVYIGHTTNFNQRKGKHKSNCNNMNGSSYNQKVYKMIRDNGGWEMFWMIEIKKYPCKDKQEAERGEYDIIQKLKEGKKTQIMNTHFFYSDEEMIHKQKNFEDYKRNKMKYNECVQEYNNMIYFKEFFSIDLIKYHEIHRDKIEESLDRIDMNRLFRPNTFKPTIYKI